MENDGIPEGQLGLLYLDLVPVDGDGNSGTPKPKSTLAQGMKLMANIPLAALRLKAQLDEDADPDNKEVSEELGKDLVNIREHSAATTASATRGLVQDVLMAMTLQDQEVAAEAARREEEEELRAQQQQKIASGILSLEDNLEKKSPAHNLWQVWLGTVCIEPI